GPGWLHIAVVLLGPAWLWIRHLGQQHEVASLLGSRSIARIAVNPCSFQKGVDDVDDAIVIKGVMIPVRGARPLSRPAFRKTRPQYRIIGWVGETVEALRPGSVGILSSHQLLEGVNRCLVNFPVLKPELSVDAHEKPQRSLRHIVI